MADHGGRPKAVRVRLASPIGLLSHYATNFSIQATNHEFMITFYEARPPVIAGTAEEQAAQWSRVTEVEAQPLARIIIAASRMPEFLQVLQESIDKSRAEPEKAATEVER